MRIDSRIPSNVARAVVLVALLATGCAPKRQRAPIAPSPPFPEGKPDYKVMTSSNPVAVYYDIRFTFEIVEGKGIVRTTP